MYIVQLIIGFVLLLIGGEALVKGSIGVAVRFNISMLIIGLTVVAFGTSAPELFISTNASLMDHGDIAVGNIIGSCLYNITLVLGISALIYAIPTEKQVLKFDLPVLLLGTVLFFIFISDHYLARWEGITLFTVLIIFLFLLVKKSLKEAKGKKEATDKFPKSFLFRDIALILGGSIALMFGSDFFLKGAEQLAHIAGLSDKIIGLTVVAFGTSVPELVTTIIAAFKKRTDISIGNLVGSNIFNLLAVGGLTAIINPVVIENDSFGRDAIWMLASSLLMFPIIFFGNKVGRVKGSILVIFIILYTLILLYT